MMFNNELNTLSGLLEEIEILRKRSELLEFILGYYNQEEETFIFPKEFKTNINPDKLPAKNPRHFLKKMIAKKLTAEDCYSLGIDPYDQ